MIFTSQAYGKSQEQLKKEEIWFSGNVLWPGNELAHTSVEVFKDPQFKNLYSRALLLKPDGIYAISIEDPGTYYLVAFVDHNDNSTFDTGDAMGIYGVSDWANPNQKPKPLKLEKGAKLTGIDIPITAVVDSQGRVNPLSAFDSSFSSGISGKVIWPDNNTSGAIVFVYSDPTWNNRIAQTEAREYGRYEIQVPPGRYYVIAVIDENHTNLLDAGDKFGIWGMTRFGAFPKPIKVEEGQMVKDRNILIIGKMGISGKALPLKPETGEVKKDGDS
ncbi:hypothetical protein FJZ33_05290, partial [Candidatus Poribacteria bacterium]|nr:hypothetical protein [Candidatus Poribacteria bacterium]